MLHLAEKEQRLIGERTKAALQHPRILSPHEIVRLLEVTPGPTYKAREAVVLIHERTGQSEAADSWVGHGPNKQIGHAELEQAVGPQVLETLSRQTGLSREEIVARLSRNLPEAVDKYTPEGRIPTELDLSTT
jgi:YidB-like protein